LFVDLIPGLGNVTVVGRVVAIHGDNLLAEYESVVDAVQCAVEIQKEIKGRNEELPEAITKVAPTYPDIAREAGVDGTVMVQALVGKDGRVKDTRVVKSIPMLDAAAAAATPAASTRCSRWAGRAPCSSR
jgi:TonB family protein